MLPLVYSVLIMSVYRHVLPFVSVNGKND